MRQHSLASIAMMTTLLSPSVEADLQQQMDAMFECDHVI